MVSHPRRDGALRRRKLKAIALILRLLSNWYCVLFKDTIKRERIVT